MSSVFIDTNIFYNILFKTDLTQTARKILEEFEDRKFCSAQILLLQENTIKLLKRLRTPIAYEEQW